MARKTFDELVAEAAAEEREANATVETETETTVDDNQPEPEVQPEPEPQPEPELKAEPEPEAKPETEPAPEQKPDPIADEIDNTNSVIRKRLEKQAKKYEDQMAKMREDYEARLKAVEERTAPKQEVKTRKDFEFDEDYVAYLTKQQIEADRAEQAKAKAEKDAEDAKAAEEQAQAAEAVRQRQERFRNNIDSCFEGEERDTLLSRIKYVTSKGFGEILDNCPVACDYLLTNPKGPLVLAKLLDADHPEYFKRVFPVTGISPLDQYSELKDIERSVIAEREARKADPTPAAMKAAPKLGKPGVQGQGGTGGDPMRGSASDRRAYVRSIMGY